MEHGIEVLVINVENGQQNTEHYPVGEYFGPVDLGWHLTEQYGGLNFGIGLFAGSIFSGSNRLIVTGNAPAWEGFYVSTMGGAGLVFQEMGINMLVLHGRAPSPSVLYLNRKADGVMEIEIAPIPVETIWEGATQDSRGVYGLMDAVLDRYGDRFQHPPRILATGPSAQATDFGAIGSAPVKKGKRTAVDTWAGRGGFGSKMVREHGIAAVIFGGEVPRAAFRDRRKADAWFVARYGMGFAAQDKAGTVKYHFDPQKGTGGTLGSNYAAIGGALLACNYRSVTETEAHRMARNDAYILPHYLAQFNDEIQNKKAHKNCGEPCAVMCKKMNGDYKKDYEPYQAMGPQIGVFDQRAAERINRHADTMGFDAIAIGGVLAWLMEALDADYISPRDLGVDARPRWRPHPDDVVATSSHNAQLGVALIDAIIRRHGVLDLRDGARALAHRLADRFDARIADLFVSTAHGDKGWMVPNQYWTPGALSPMPIMGKYYMYYGHDFIPPYALGKRNAERFRKELMLDNIGMCRFHRAWAEEMVPELIGHIYGVQEAYVNGIDRLAVRINAHNRSRPWASRRIFDFIYGFLVRKRDVDHEDAPELHQWIAAFEEDREKAAQAYWQAIRDGIDDTLVNVRST